MNNEVLSRLRVDYPELCFIVGKRDAFRPPKTIIVDPNGSSLSLLHEVGHALCHHRTFNTAIQRLKMEREAWEKARELCRKYEVLFDDDFVEDELDSYRNWVEKKSRCPICGLARFQSLDGNYFCPKCDLD